ncbi:MAG: radical SAM protein [Isosphaeraceae bacterium]
MITIIFKPLEVCNARCVYCDVIKKQQTKVMDLSLLELVFSRIGNFLHAKPQELLNLIWHGGEPTLLGEDYYRKAFEFQERYCCGAARGRVRHFVQSNLTRLTQGVVDAFLALGIDRVGSSYDPIPGIRGMGPERDSRLYNRLFFKGARLLEKNGMSWGLIYTVNRKSLERPRDIFNFLTNLNPSSSPAFNKIYGYGEDIHGLNISQEEYAQFLGDLFPLWWENQKRYGAVRPFEYLTSAVRGGRSKPVCEHSGLCANRWVYIGPTGDSSQCGRGGDFNAISYGNIRDRSLEQILYDEKRQLIARRNSLLPSTECSGCRLWGLCHGGCPMDALIDRGSFLRKSANCGWLKIFIERYFEPLTGLKVDMMPEPTVHSLG